MTALVTRANSMHLPLRDESVDLIITSPPYFALRSYRDGGEHYDGQIGSEPTPQAFLDALWTVTEECWRVLKPTGSMFVNLGDKRSGSGGHNNAGLSTAGSTLQGTRQQERVGNREERLADLGRSKPDTRDIARATRRNAPDRYNQAAFGRPKSKMMLPHRYAIGCEDGMADPEGIGWIMRQDQVWSKLNGLPESVKDRTRDSHEYWFHLTKEETYYSAIDEIRLPPSGYVRFNGAARATPLGQKARSMTDTTNSKGALPGSVWEVATEPLIIPEWLELDHFAAFPTEWPRRFVVGWSPPAICLECGEGRFPVTETEHEVQRLTNGERTKRHEMTRAHNGGFNSNGYPVTASLTTIVGYACACTPFTDHPEHRRSTSTPKREDLTHRPADTGGSNTLPPPGPPVREYHLDDWTPPSTRPAVVLDPFGGTGTTAMVARALGRIGISVDLSADYCRLARWRIFDSGHASRVRERRNRELQGALL